MLVSLAVLALALSVVGVVFTITTKTVTQAAAYSEANNWIRHFTIQLKKDLDATNPSKSILTMVGRVQPAGLTKHDVDVGRYHRVLTGNPLNVPGGYDWELRDTPTGANSYELQQYTQYSDPRADLLMFFSQRPAISQAPPRDPNNSNNPYSAGAKLAPIQVVYGHAALADSAVSGSPVRHIELQGDMSPVPASSWHLARRATIIEYDLGRTSFVSGGVGGWGDETQSIVPCYDQVANDDLAGDVGHLDRQALWFEFGPFSPFAALTDSPYELYPQARPLVDGLLYLDGVEQNHHVATVVERVSVEERSNLGVQMLPGCTWFQIEFLMPEDPRNSLDFPGRDPTNINAGDSRRSDVPRWTEVTPGDTYLFVPDTQENRDAVIQDAGTRLLHFARIDQNASQHGNLTNTAEPIKQRRVRMWPYAIRITVRVYDPLGRLTDPIVRSVVHRFQ